MNTKYRSLMSLAAGLAIGFCGASTQAQLTWSGGGGDANWATAGNWGGSVPANGELLTFAGITRVVNTNNLTGLTFNGLSFNNSDFALYGNAITNTAGIYDNVGLNTNNLVMYLKGSQGFTNASGNVLQLGGAVTSLGTGNTLTFGGPGNIYLTGIWSGNAIMNINGDGAGNGLVRLSGVNTFTGPLTINSGTLQLGNASGIPSGAGKGDVTNNATLDLNGLSPTIDGLFGTGTVDNKAGTSTYTLTVGNNATNTGGWFEFDGTLQNTSGSLALTKVNTNIFYLNGNGNYSGATLVSAGEMILGSSVTLPNSPSITVAQGAQLDVSQQSSFAIGSSQALYAGRNNNFGPGDILGSVDNSGKIVVFSPGAPGTLNITNNLTLESGSTIAFDLGNTNTPGLGSNDLVTINGTLTLNGGTIALNPYQGSLATGQTYTLITNSQALESGSAANMTVAVPRGITATLNDTAHPGSLMVAISGSGIPVSLVWDGLSEANWDVQTTTNWLNNNVLDYFYYLDNVVFNDVGNGNVTVATGVSPSTTTFSNSATNAYTLSSPGAISGSGPLTVNGGGEVLLNTANDYTGDTIVNYGQLLLGNVPNNFNPDAVVYAGVNPGNLILGAGGVYQVGVANATENCLFNTLILNSGGSSITMRNRQSSSTPFFQFTSPIIRNVGATLTMPSLATRATSKAGVYFTTPTLTNGIFGGYASIYLNDWVAILVDPQGNFATNYNLYQISATPSAWGATSNVLLSASTTANINTTTINSLKISAAATATINAGQTLTLASGGILIPNNGTGSGVITGGALQGAPNADLIVMNNALLNTLTIGSTIIDNGGPTALTKSGEGTLILTGANTYTGATYINGAEISGGTLAAPPLAFYPAGTLQVGAGGTAGNLGNTAAITNYGTLAFDRSDNVSLGLAVNGPGGLKQMGGGILTLTVNNNYSGPTVISGGTLQVGTGSAAGSLGGSTSITNNGILVFDRPDAVVINSPISGSGSLVNFGAGTLSLNNSNAYAGLTVVSNGTITLGSAALLPNTIGIVLASSGSKLDVSAVSGGITLNGGSVGEVLVGYGTVNGSVTLTNNTGISPGTNGVVGALTINNNLTLAGGNLYFDAGSSVRDTLTVGGALTVNSGNFVLNSLNTIPNATYKLIGYGSFSGAVGNLSFSGFAQAGQLAYLTNNVSAKEIDLVVYNGAGANLTWVGDGGNNYWDIATSADWNNGAGASVFHNNDNVTFDDSSANTTVGLYTNVSPGSVTINTLNNNYTFSDGSGIGSGMLGGGGKVTINATNTTVTVTVPLNNSGPTVINTGTVQVGNGSTAGMLGVGVVSNNAVVNFNEPANAVFSGALAGAGGLFNQDSYTLYLEGNNSAYHGPITISAGAIDVGGGTGNGNLGSGLITNNGTLLVEHTGAGTLAINNNITGTGPVAFIGSGPVTYGGNNSYAAYTYISNGIVKLGSPAAIPADGGTGDWLELDGNPNGSAGVFDLNGHNISVNALSGVNATANGMIDNNGGTGTNALAIIGTATTASFSGAIYDNTGTGGKIVLVVEGGGNQTLDVESVAGNTFTGGTIISNSSVTLTSSTANSSTANFGNPIGLGTGPVTLYNGTVYAVGYANSGPTWTSLANTVVIPTNYTGTIYGPGRGTVGANLTGGGNLTYVTTYVRGSINGNWSAFNGQITFENTTAGGQLGIGNTAGFGHVFCTNAAGSGGVTLYNIVAGTPTIPIGELADDGTTAIEATTSGNAGGVAANFAVGGLNTSTNFGGSIIDAVGIIKVGTGSWTLTSGTLTYSGLTTVSNGVLVLGASATLPNTTPITLAAPGILDVSAAGTLTLGTQTLQGNGTLNGSLTAGSASTVSPGGANNLGTLTITNALTLGGTLLLELNRTNTPANSDRVVAASIAAGGTLQVNNIGPDLHTGDVFQLFSTNVTGNFTATNLPVTTSDGSITYVWTNNLAVNGTIAVLVGEPNVNPNPTNLTAVVTNNGTALNLSWPADHIGWRLVMQTNNLAVGLENNSNAWTTVVGSASVNSTNLPINPALPAVFYRLVYP